MRQVIKMLKAPKKFSLKEGTANSPLIQNHIPTLLCEYILDY